MGGRGWLADPTRPGGGSWYNHAEVEKVRDVVAQLRECLPEDATIGVVTPFAAQKDRIVRALEGMKARVGTAHTFQGGECDAMVLSLVGGPEMHRASISWLERSANLWNVAVTRARAHLVVVGNRDFWRGRAGIVGGLERATTGDLGSLGPPDGGPDATGDELHLILEQRFPAAYDRDAACDGYPCDFRIDLPREGRPADSIAVILDRGADGVAAARHLRLQFERREQLRAAGMSAAARVPAWQVHAEPDRVISALTAGVGMPATSWDNGDGVGGGSEHRPADRGVQSS